MENTQYELNKGLAQMLKGGVIMDVTTHLRRRSRRGFKEIVQDGNTPSGSHCLWLARAH